MLVCSGVLVLRDTALSRVILEVLFEEMTLNRVFKRFSSRTLPGNRTNLLLAELGQGTQGRNSVILLRAE